MKRYLMVVLLCSLILLSGCGRQTASARICNDTSGATAIIDLRGGWSVDFAGDCFVLQDGDISEDRECTAIGTILDKEIYDDYIREAKASDTYRKKDNAVYFENEDGEIYLCEVNDDTYFMLVAHEKGDEVFKRISFAKVD